MISFNELLVENKLALQRDGNADLVWTHGRAVNWIHWVKDCSSSGWHCLQIRQEEVRVHVQFPLAVPRQRLVFLWSFSPGVTEVQELAFCQILDRGRNHHGSRLTRCFSRTKLNISISQRLLCWMHSFWRKVGIQILKYLKKFWNLLTISAVYLRCLLGLACSSDLCICSLVQRFT